MKNTFKHRLDKIKNELKKYKINIILSLVALFLIFVAYEYYYRYFYILKSPTRVKSIIMSYGKYSIVAFIILQILQVIAFFIPGEVVQIAGGYIYGTLGGSFISILGITMGSLIAYGIAHLYGRPLIKKIVAEDKLESLEGILGKSRGNYIVFLLYLIPGLPKDVMAYVCGISSIDIKSFFFYSTLGRIPGIIISAFFGSNINNHNKFILIFIAVVMTILFIVGVLKGEKIIDKVVKK